MRRLLTLIIILMMGSFHDMGTIKPTPDASSIGAEHRTPILISIPSAIIAQKLRMPQLICREYEIPELEDGKTGNSPECWFRDPGSGE